MSPKPRTAAGYPPNQVEQVRATCLYVATRLGDMLDDVVVVGGLVPSLLIDQGDAKEKHVGTLDLDVGLSLAVFDDKRYQGLIERLRQANFSPDVNERGNQTHQRWKIDGPPTVTVDFLIPPTEKRDRGGGIKNIKSDFAAIIAPGLRLAFRDRVKVSLRGKTIRGERAQRDIGACGPGAFVAMKALSLRSRGENKDAYDLVYFLQNYRTGIDGVAAQLIPLLSEAEALEAVRYLDEEFATVDSVGPLRTSEFLFDDRNDAVEADAWGVVRALLDKLPH